MSHLNRLVSLRSSFFSLSQIIFEPPADEDAQPIGLVEVRLCAGDAFHADLLCEMRQVLESLGLDVLASQPAGGAAALDADARCALLYAREAGGSLQVAASRRAQIRVALLELLSELQLSGAKLHVAGSEPPKLSAPFRARSRFWCARAGGEPHPPASKESLSGGQAKGGQGTPRIDAPTHPAFAKRKVRLTAPTPPPPYIR